MNRLMALCLMVVLIAIGNTAAAADGTHDRVNMSRAMTDLIQKQEKAKSDLLLE